MRQSPPRTVLLLAAGVMLLLSPTVRRPEAEAASPIEDGADLVLTSGRFYPVVPAGVVEGGLAVRDGRIAYFGTTDGARRLVGPDTTVVDLRGRAVTPGWIDAHSHLAGLGEQLAQVDLVGTESYAEVIRLVREAARELPAGAWVRGRGWDQNDWATPTFPDRAALDRAVPDHPVWLSRIDGHAALVNGRALELLGLGAGTPDPQGGRLLRDADGRLTGVLIDDAMDAAEWVLPEPTPAELRQRIRRAAVHALSVGLTTVTEMGVDPPTVRAYQQLRRAGELPIRVAVFVSGDDEEQLAEWERRGPQADPADRLQVRGIKLYADGALGSRGAALLEPYADDPGNRGLLRTDAAEIEAVCRRAVGAGFQVGTHAIGDRANRMVLDAYERCFEGGGRPDLRFRIEHAQVMRLPDIRRLGRLGVIASMQPTHATSDMPWAPDRLGAGRLDGAYAWRKVLDAGARLALGSDFPVESANPMLGLYAAVARQDLAGQPAGGWLPGELLTRREALRGFTLDAAYALFLEDDIGSLEVGKRADLVVFDRDPMQVPEREIPEVRVDLVVLDGRIVHRREEAGR